MIFQLNKNGKILSVTKEDKKAGEAFPVLSGYNFVSLVVSSDSTAAAKFLGDIRERSETVTCMLGLTLEDNSGPRYECIGIPIDADKICVIARKKESDDSGRSSVNAGAPASVDASTNAQLAEAKQRFRVLFNNLPVSLLLVNSKGAVEAVNPTAERMFGYSGTAWRDHDLNKLFEASGDVTSAYLFNRLADSTGKISRFDGFRSTGEKFPMEITPEFIDLAKTKLLLCAVDISERIKLEQLKKEFVEMVSHDLRTPLSNLVLFLESITLGFHKKWSEEKLKGNAERNFEEVSRLIRLINKLLDIDKLEEGFSKPELIRLLLTDSIDSAVNAVNPTAMKKGIKFKCNHLDLMIMADSDQLAQILINLLGNSVKFSPEDSTITIDVVEVPDAVEIRIIDQGPGIPANLVDHIFERFGQVKTAKAKEGTGLGLAICKSIVEAHGGTIGVRSEEGHGSEFWFRLPYQSNNDKTESAEHNGDETG